MGTSQFETCNTAAVAACWTNEERVVLRACDRVYTHGCAQLSNSLSWLIGNQQQCHTVRCRNFLQASYTLLQIDLVSYYGPLTLGKYGLLKNGP